MDDDHTVSTKSECLKALETVELRNWLSHHNKYVSKRYEHHVKSEKQRRELLQGLTSERNPERTLGTILELAFPRTVKKSGQAADVSRNAVACNRAVQTMLHNPSFHDRYRQGLHPVTLLAEQRRKVVLNALTDIDFPDEEKRLSKQKLSEMLDARNGSPSADGTRNVTPILAPLQASSTGSLHSHSVHMPIRKFKPKWEDYDVMRTRWGYLQPQVRKFTHEDKAHSPQKSQKYVKVDRQTVIHGSVNDIHHFQMKHERKSVKFSNITARSQKIVNDRLDEESRHYVPSPCVRY